MHKVLRWFAAIGVAALSAAGHAEVLTLPGSAAVPAELPQRGMSQAAVLKAYGEPTVRHAPAGGGSPRHPPIIRWDYPGWSVFFEQNWVIDVVVRDAPAPLHHVDELKTAP